jgi:hypothetical protein
VRPAFFKRVFAREFCFLSGLALAVSTPVSLLAHHSFAAEYDDKQPVKITGTITKVEWANPHIWFYLSVKNPDNTVTTWGFSGGAPGQLMRRGIVKSQLKIGTVVVVDGFRAKDGSTNAASTRVKFPDGRNVLTDGGSDKPADEK